MRGRVVFQRRREARTCWLFAFPILCATLAGVEYTAGQQADSTDDGLDGLVSLLGEVEDDAFRRDLLGGMLEALRGRRDVSAPRGWDRVRDDLLRSQDEVVRRHARFLSVLFGERAAIRALRAEVLDRSAKPEQRQGALQLLLDADAPDMADLLRALLEVPEMRGPAIRGLARYPSADDGATILGIYGQLNTDLRRDALRTLAAGVETARRMLDAMSDGTIDARDLDAYTARQIHSLDDAGLRRRLEEVWGVVRGAGDDSRRRIEQYKSWLTEDYLKDADVARGRVLYREICGSCHLLRGEGGEIGPDLTGSNRDNLHYVLENVLDPSAVVAKPYTLTRVETTKGRVLSGILETRPNGSLAVRTPTELVVVPAEQVADVRRSETSMMPDGLLDKLSREEVRDLIGYLGAP